MILGCLLVAWVLGDAKDGKITTVLQFQAIVVGIGLAVSAALDYQRGLRNLVRCDLVCLGSLFFLTYVEFLFPQPGFDLQASGYDLAGSSRMVLLGIGGIALGRHARFRFATGGGAGQGTGKPPGLAINHWLWLLWVAAGFGYLSMLLAVNFNVVEMVEAMMGPRFSQPWSRGKLGDWKALIFELSMFIFIIPPVYGVLLAKRKQVPTVGFAVATFIALFTLFYGFSSGTRNVFATYLAGMIGAYLLVLPKLRLKQVVVAGLIGGGLLYSSTNHMLAFRQIGLSTYLKYGAANTIYEDEDSSFFVDANLLNMAILMDAIPAKYDYTGLDVPYNALIRPIPRAIWPGKPEGLKVGIEEAAGVEGMTLAVTFAGESYMAAGWIGVLLGGLFFGVLCGFWNSRFRGRWSTFSQVVYAAGFVPAAISMRSLLSLTTAILPIFGLLFVAYFLKRNAGETSPSGKAGRRSRRRPSSSLPRPSPDADPITGEPSESQR